MDENDKPDGSTAMERLCRELMEAVVSCAPTVWCGEHGIGIHGTRPEQDREHARADIERRIADARGEDECTHTYPERELKRMTGMYLDGRRCTRGEVNEMVDAVEGWKAKAAELDALKSAGRVMPEGLSWPRYDDGRPVLLGDEVDGDKVSWVVLNSIRYEICNRDNSCLTTDLYGKPVERPAPKAVGADGVEVKPGDTVWLAKGYRERAGSHGTRRDGYLVVAEYNLIGASALEGMTVYETLDDSCVSLTARGSWCPASWLTHTAPCTDKDGAPIDEGDEVWTEDGCRWKVLGIKSGGHPVQAKCVEGCHRGKRRDLKWTWVSHERPDSWERLREDAVNDFTYYWGCHASPCLECPCKTGGKNPKERYGVGSCRSAMHLDLVARAERLAGVSADAR